MEATNVRSNNASQKGRKQEEYYALSDDWWPTHHLHPEVTECILYSKYLILFFWKPHTMYFSLNDSTRDYSIPKKNRISQFSIKHKMINIKLWIAKSYEKFNVTKTILSIKMSFLMNVKTFLCNNTRQCNVLNDSKQHSY